MKKLLWLLILFTSFQALALGKTLLSKDQCSELSSVVIGDDGETSSGDFYYNGTGELNSDLGNKYLKNTNKVLKNKMSDFCKSKKVGAFVEDFADSFGTNCQDGCADQSLIYMNAPISNKKDKRKNATIECTAICASIQKKLSFYISGIDFGKNIKSIASKDCNGDVNTSKNRSSKIDSLNNDIEKIKSSPLGAMPK